MSRQDLEGMRTAPVSRDIAAALGDFSDNPTSAGHRLQSALRADSTAFLTALLREPETVETEKGFRYAINLMVNGDAIISAIATPSVTSFEEALRLTRYVLGFNGTFINSLLTATLTLQALADRECTLRVLDLIGKCATHLANWRSLTWVHADGDPQIKAKCAALLAHFRFGDEAGLERFRRSEPRVRADIIQTLWNGAG